MNNSAKKLSNQGDDLVDTAADQAYALGKRGISAASGAAKQALDSAANASDALIKYTKKNPTKALLVAAATGAALLALVKILTPSRD